MSYCSINTKPTPSSRSVKISDASITHSLLFITIDNELPIGTEQELSKKMWLNVYLITLPPNDVFSDSVMDVFREA